jgi:predicted metal-binding membrane protein
VLLVVAAGAWLATIAYANDMGALPGPMGLGLVGFLGVWTPMMAAMMLPSIVPLTSLYTRTMRDRRLRRVTLLTVGYLAVWAAAGIVAFVLADGAEWLADTRPGWAHTLPVAARTPAPVRIVARTGG